jgi:cytochrome P450
MVEEILRYDPPVMQAARFASATLKINDTTIEAGEQINISLLAAAHDPAGNPDPHRFDIERPNPRHLSFGGAHFCLGAPLARAEAEIAIPLLFERFPTLRLDPDHTLRHKATPPFLGVEALWVQT